MISLGNLLCALTKREQMLENNQLWKTFVYICLLYVQDENQDMLMQQKRLYLYSLFTLAFQLLILK